MTNKQLIMANKYTNFPNPERSFLFPALGNLNELGLKFLLQLLCCVADRKNELLAKVNVIVYSRRGKW